MAILSSDGKYVTVEKGDTLSEIALEYLKSASKYKDLAALNEIVNPDRIYPGQKIYLDKETAPKSTQSSAKKAVILQFGVLSTSEKDNELFATWKWSKESQTESYLAEWVYDTGDGFWINGSSNNITVSSNNYAASRQSLYTIPSGARRVRFRVKPISKKKAKTESTYWTASWSDTKIHTDSTPVSTPSAPSSVTIKDTTLTVELTGIENTITYVEFQVNKNHSAGSFNTSKKIKVTAQHATYSCTVDLGADYKVRCRVWDDDGQKSEWSDYSSVVSSKPNKPSGFTTVSAADETSVFLSWAEVPTAAKYEIEYVDNPEHFDTTDAAQKIETEFTSRTILNLTTGTTYYFRLRVYNKHGVASDWSNHTSVSIGENPEPPTTWTYVSTAVIGEPITFYWLHNPKDGSYQRSADIQVIANGVEEIVPTLTFTEDDADTVSTYTLDTSKYTVDTTIEWRVRTCGVTGITSDWSITREIRLYIRPELHLSLYNAADEGIETLTDFPLKVKANVKPATQTPVGFYLTISAGETYETVDVIGNPKTINAGDNIYSKHFDTDSLDISITAGDIDFENGIPYTVSCTAALSSGLTAEHSLPLEISWSDVWSEPNAEIAIDSETYTASITPYCDECEMNSYIVAYSDGVYTKTDEFLPFTWGEPVAGVKTTTGETVYQGVDGSGNQVHFCMVQDSTSIQDVWLSVYRREFDGSFTEIASGLDGARRVTVSDPHPALDYARYRIVATNKDTGTISYTDLPGYPVGGTAVLIQWNEQWSSFEVGDDEIPAAPAWSGSLLKLPYNIEVSSNNNLDVAMIEYIGRAHPVTYYGTQVGETASWSVVIDAEDIETLYGLRRLAKWMGDAYVREPSGSGYWAHVKVSFSKKYNDLTIPVTLDITRVEGGI